MPRLVMELTNRCNLACRHCFAERHAATGDLPLDILDTVLREGHGLGIDHLAFTGGEATLHRSFEEIVRRVSAAGYGFGVVTNGATFPQVYSLFVEHRRWFDGVTFSLDGASEEVHDRQRGTGSYRRVLRAASICVVRDLPFSINMSLTKENRHEVGDMIALAARLGAAAVRFGHLMSTRDTALRGLDLSPAERHEVEAEIRTLEETASLQVSMAPGHFSESPFFPCAPLEVEEFNLDYRGNLTLCCQLSGHSGSASDGDVIGSLHEMTLAEACARFRERVAAYLAAKRLRVRRGEFGGLDHFPCWYCLKYLGKAASLGDVPGHAWAEDASEIPAAS